MRLPNRVVLKLNADMQPLQMAPWQEVVHLLIEGSATALENYTWDDGSPMWIRSGPGEDGKPKIQLEMPAVIVLHEYINFKREVRFSRHNVLQRDLYTCQYCGDEECDITIDHILPRSKGGRSTFENCVGACHRCQLQKGSRLLEEMKREKTWNGRPFRLMHVPTEIRRPGNARFVYRVSDHNLCWLRYIPGWERIAARVGRKSLIEKYARWELQVSGDPDVLQAAM